MSLLYGSNRSKRLKSLCMTFLPPLLFPKDPVAKRLFSPHVVMSKILHHIALLLTFGVAFPPLAVLILVTVCVTTLAWQVLTGRYITQRREVASRLSSPPMAGVHSTVLLAKPLSGADDSARKTSQSSMLAGDISDDTTQQVFVNELFELNSLCDGVRLCPQSSIWVIIYCTSFFSSLLVFDIAGDRSGWFLAACLFSLPMLCAPAGLRLIFRYPCRCIAIGGSFLKSLFVERRQEEEQEEDERREPTLIKEMSSSCSSSSSTASSRPVDVEMPTLSGRTLIASPLHALPVPVPVPAS